MQKYIGAYGEDGLLLQVRDVDRRVGLAGRRQLEAAQQRVGQRRALGRAGLAAAGLQVLQRQ